MITTWDDLSFFETHFHTVVEKLHEQKRQGKNILPDEDNILNAFYYTPFDQVKVIILGQDPYPNSNHAHGLAFSVPEGVKPFPASLRNIFKELENDIGCPQPASGCLIPWAVQGVLLLNTALTVVEGSIGSHTSLGWHHLVNEAVGALSEEHEHLVFILWGKNAQAKSTYIRNQKDHLLIRATHPSPQAANRGGFFGTNPFSRTNEFLYENDKEAIEWCLAPT